MTEMDVHPDPIVRTALQRLPVPPHADDFWSVLDSALDAGSPVARPAHQEDERKVFVAAPEGSRGTAPLGRPGAGPEHDPSLALVPVVLRRTSNALLVAVAAAAVVVVTVAGNTLLDERNGTRSISSPDDASSSAALQELITDARPDPTTPVTLSAASAAASSEAALAWVQDLASADSAGAWRAMGPVSQAHFGSQRGFEREMSALADGYGPWSTAERGEVIVTPVATTDEGTMAVVTLLGTVDRGGTSERLAVAFPVWVVGGEAMLEPFAVAGELEVVVPEAATARDERSPVGSGEELVIVVPSDARAPVLRLDDGDTVVCGSAEGTELTDLDGLPGQRCSYLPRGGITPGEHTLTVAFVGSDGASISAASMLFDAA